MQSEGLAGAIGLQDFVCSIDGTRGTGESPTAWNKGQKRAHTPRRKHLWTVPEVAKELGYSTAHIEYLCRNGRLQAYKIPKQRGSNTWTIESLEVLPGPDRHKTRVLNMLRRLQPVNLLEAEAVQVVIQMVQGTSNNRRPWGTTAAKIKEHAKQHNPFNIMDIERHDSQQRHAIRTYVSRQIKMGNLKRVGLGMYAVANFDWLGT